MTENDLQTISNLVSIMLCVSAWIAQERLFRKIKKNYYQKWLEIGEPGWKTFLSFDSSKFHKGLLTLGYLLNGDSLLDSKPDIRKLKNATKLVYLLVFISIILIFMTSVILESSMS